MVDNGTDSLQHTLTAFIDGVSGLDWDRMRETFAPDAQVFFPFDHRPRRVDGIAAIESAFRDFFEANRAAGRIPIEPLDLMTQVFGDTALVSFHLDRPGALGRRTLLLRREAGRWRIAHLHASVTLTSG